MALYGLHPRHPPLPFPSYFLLHHAHLALASPAFLLGFTQAHQGSASGSLPLQRQGALSTWDALFPDNHFILVVISEHSISTQSPPLLPIIPLCFNFPFLL